MKTSNFIYVNAVILLISLICQICHVSHYFYELMFKLCNPNEWELKLHFKQSYFVIIIISSSSSSSSSSSIFLFVCLF